MRTLATMIFLMLFPTMVLAELPIGEIPPKVVLKDDLGGRLDGTQWSSEELVSGKVIVLFYVDPDESELNNHVSDALKAENYPKEKYGSIGMANMAATWLPNFAINMKLKSKQEQYKSTVYVKDLEKTLVKKWGLSDDNSDVVVFGKDGRVLYSVDGKFTDAQVKEIVKVVWDNLD
ncbi:MAG: YtfJ family protein [SAR324 cluster bacterium]|nr:YtfJ family protein [SAR324 cluster bacterium]MCS5554046.1 YtfJ family protein [SAR324 cluster bacterium]|tara:strand:- start:604 stop:1131 length:528 start_codon:yes stop_codon:yes gene_type:complete